MVDITGEDLLLGDMDPDDLEEHHLIHDGGLLFFHGKESGPFGTKYRKLKERFGGVVAPDFQGMNFVERLYRAEALTRGKEDLVVVGSSFGGLLIARLYTLYPERIKGYVLLAPALHIPGHDILSAPPMSEVIHGKNDDVVPLSASEAFCEAHGVPLHVVEDDHRLHGSLDLMIECVERVFL